MSQTITAKRERLMVDLLLFQAHGPDGQKLVEQTLEANIGVAALGPVLPLGTVVTLPDRSAPAATRRVVSIFG